MPLWKRTALLFALWTIPIVIVAVQRHVGYLSMDKESFLWKQMLWEVPDWYFWALFTPVVIWMGRRFPLERGAWVKNIWPHILANIVVALAWTVLIAWMTTVFELADKPFGILFRWVLMKMSVVHFFMYWGILGVGSAFEYRRRYQERELQTSQLETELAQAQLRALKMQLHPHFLFNTLHTITSLIRTADNKGAVKMIVGLSDLLRYTLENAGSHTVRLEEELDFLTRYLDIQRVRFGDRLTIDMEIAPDTLRLRVPNLILQPLVENAIHYAISPRAGPGRILVRAARDGVRLLLQVQDDGPGVPEGWQISDSNGVGLTNTQKRLDRIYGRRYTFDVGNATPGGTVATIRIPWEPAREEDQDGQARQPENSDHNR